MSAEEHAAAVGAAQQSYEELQGILNSALEKANEALGIAMSAVGQDGGPETAMEVRAGAISLAGDSSDGDIMAAIQRAGLVIQQLDSYLSGWYGQGRH